ncbi:MAG TPA: hypothetical protein VMT83_00385 [Burkholderiaceae bacterium]|nr:hypothetical protein [Burkholderiaceae bacterium]
MHDRTTPAPQPWWRPPRQWTARCRALWCDLIGAWHLATARTAPELDDAALRDLGLSRGELRSYLAEVDGLVEPTRRRVIDHHGSLP